MSLSMERMPLVRPLRGQAGISAIAGPFWEGFPLLQPALEPEVCPPPKQPRLLPALLGLFSSS